MSRRHAAPLLWAALVLAACLSLAIGAGAFNSGRAAAPSLYERTQQIAGQYRCPVCQGETVAASDAPEAVEIKQLVQGWLEQGRSPAQIRAYLVSRYGPSILEEPPASGFGSLLWALPVLAVALGCLGLGLAFRRWRLAAAPGTPRPPVAAAPPPLLGPEASQQGAALPLSRGRRASQRLTLAGGLGLVVAAAALWMVDKASSASTSDSSTATTSANLSSELEQAVDLTRTNPAAALALYDEVLAEDPTQVVALTGEGWIYAEAGFVQKGASLLTSAEEQDPSYGPAHFYRGLVLLSYEDQPKAAAAEMKWYLSHGPEAALKATAQQALALAQERATAVAGSAKHAAPAGAGASGEQ